MSLLLLSFLTISLVYTQDLPSTGGVSNNIIGHTAFIEAYDVSGKPLTEVNKKVVGSPALNENWGKGQVEFQNGFVLKNVELQFDGYLNELHFRKENIIYAFADAVKSFSMQFMDELELRTVTFRSGYPDIQKKTNGTFYKLVADGANIQLLNYTSKEIRENFTYAGPVKNEYQLNDAYYVYDVKAAVIKSINMSKASLLKTFPQYSDTIKKIATEKKYKFKSEYELIELLKIINQS